MTLKMRVPKTSFEKDMSYGNYRISTSNNCRRKIHCPMPMMMLFTIQHQTSELWMRLVLHEIGAARLLLKDAEFKLAFKMLSRVARIFDQLNSAWDVLRTMTPSDYTTFREALARSSGFQSHQYRLIELCLVTGIQP